MTRQHGINSSTYDNLIIDSGAIYIGFTDFTTKGTLLGATRGGSSFTLENEVREMEADGGRGPNKGGRRITMVKATLTVNMLEMSLDNLKRAIAGSSSATFDTTWDQITRALGIASGDYISNVALIGEVSGNAAAMGIVLTDVLADGNFELAFEDKEEGVVAVTFTAHFDPADLGAGTDTEPWSLIWPQ